MYNKLILPQALLIIKSKKCKEMENKKIAIFIGILCLIFTGITNSIAQNSTTVTNKYEIAVDLQNFFSDGTPDKVLFKLNNIKDNQIKGAYRFGLGYGYYSYERKGKYGEEEYETWDENKRKRFQLVFGYEKQKRLNTLVLYYGVDFKTIINFYEEVPEQSEDLMGEDNYYELGLNPFVGLTVPLAPHLSTSFEAGLENYFYRFKAEVGKDNNYTKDYVFNSSLRLPYSLTINYFF